MITTSLPLRKLGSGRLSDMPALTQPVSVPERTDPDAPGRRAGAFSHCALPPCHLERLLMSLPTGESRGDPFQIYTYWEQLGLTVSGDVTQFHHKASIQLGHSCCPTLLPVSQIPPLQRYFLRASLSATHSLSSKANTWLPSGFHSQMRHSFQPQRRLEACPSASRELVLTNNSTPGMFPVIPRSTKIPGVGTQPVMEMVGHLLFSPLRLWKYSHRL